METMSSSNVETVDVGEVIVIGSRPGNQYTIVAACPDDTNTTGHWYCATHNEGFRNNMSKDAHIDSGTHRLAWICHLHGPEKP
jgi:hypothetical protein